MHDGRARAGEGTRRYIHPPPLETAISGDPPLKRVPRDSKLLVPRRQPARASA